MESIALDPKDKKLTLTGDIDPVVVVGKLRKLCSAEIVSVGPAKEPKKEEPKKDDKKKEKEDEAAQLLKAYQAYYQHHNYYQPYQQPAAVAPLSYYHRSVEEDPNSCVIC